MILVTGGTGFIGSFLLFKLSQTENEIYATKRESSNLDKTKQIFIYNGDESLVLFNKIKWIDVDILDYDKLNEVTKGMKYVYHAAAFVSFNPADKYKMCEINEQGTANITYACINNNVSKLCHVSTIGTLSNSTSNDYMDEMSFWQGGKEESAYSISKFRAEMQVWRASNEGLKSVIVNPSIVLGPGDAESPSNKLLKTIQKGLKYYPKGCSGFVDVRDVVDAMTLLTNSNIYNERFVLNSDNYTYKYILDSIAEKMNVNTPKKELSDSLGYFACKLEKIRSFVLNREPIITKDNIRAAQSSLKYNGNKITNTINFNYRPIKQTINDMVDYYLK